MMDHFMEEVVVKRNRAVQNIAHAFATVTMVVCAIMGMIMLNMLMYNLSVIAVVETVIVIGFAVLLFLRRDRLKTEYEYTFTNGELDFAMVFNNQKRKSLGTMRVKNVDAFGPVDSNAFRKFLNTPGVKKRNWFLNRDAKLYFFYYQKEQNKNMIIFEPSEELVGMIRKYLPMGTYQE